MISKRTKITVLTVTIAVIFAAVFGRPRLHDGMSWSRGYYDSNGNLLRLTLSQDDKFRVWTPLKDFSPKLVEAVLLKEDKYFRYHWGVNPLALARAAWVTYGAKTRRMGGSTLSMQLARLRYKIYTKSIVGKIEQILTATWIETFCSKEEILEAYLNLLPYGNNVEGAGTASLVFFHKNPKRLTLPETMTLAVIPQSPSMRAPEDGKESAALVSERRMFFEKWTEIHPEDRNRAFEIKARLDPTKIRELPFLAPHFINSLASSPNEKTVTTLDLKLQKLLEMKLKSYVERHKHIGVSNGAALLIDYKTMEVKASVGSADFFDGKIQGQVNGVNSKRSPGSTLKPFVYALAFDQGLAHPMTLLKDAPVSFGGFDPENFDKDFYGPISVSDALIKSRNVPAVAMASQLQKPSFYEFLKEAEISNLRDESVYGLSTVLGAAEVTMEELVKLYAALPNGGILKPLTKIASENKPADTDGKRLFSPEAAFLVLDILSHNPRPGFSIIQSDSDIPVAWKTGTSQGFRDAWSVGVLGPYVLAVWLGNFDNSANPAFVGRDLAAPLLFEIADGLKPYLGRPSMFWPKPSMNLTQIDVCAVSGLLPGPHCHKLKKTWFIPGRSPIQTCAIHRELKISRLTGLRLCDGINTSNEPFDNVTYEFWPSDLMKIFREAGVPRRQPPSWDSRCSKEDLAATGVAPQIVSPRKDVVYFLRAAQNDRNKISLSAVTDADVRETFWFVNNEFIGKQGGAAKNPILWPAKLGKYVVRVIDDHGRSDHREIDVRLTE